MLALACGGLLVTPGKAAADKAALTVAELSRLSIEDLADIPVTSVSKRAEPLSQAPAAIFVITQDDIRRSGATSIPEVLRMAPNLQVARVGASTYAITARGFNHSTATANKLLVLIDGRVVYSPLFSGVFWDAQNVMLADIERIEVISGPAGTLWGANAVNGVINIITRSTKDTQGTLVDVKVGSIDDSVSARHGGTLGDNATYRVYGMGLHNGNMLKLSGAQAQDGWDNAQGGFRIDWSEENDAATLQGDIYSGNDPKTTAGVANGTIGGQNLMANWSRQLTDGSSLKLQIYYDNARRDLTSGIRATVDTYDVDGQYGMPIGQGQNLIVGGGYRVTHDTFVRGPGTSYLDPASRTLSLGNVFAQDSVEIDSGLSLTLGLKAENNSYTGLEFMPDARLTWRASDTAVIWGSVSRAVRTPSRFDRDLINPGLFAGGPDFTSEDLLAFELGYRGQPFSGLSLSVSTYLNSYTNLRTVEASGPYVFPLVVENNMRGNTYGIEAWSTYTLTDWWRLNASVNAMCKELQLVPGNHDVFGVGYAGNDPSYQFQMRSDMDLPNRMQLELGLRNVDALASPVIPNYLEAELRLNWQVSDQFELSLAGENLLHGQHQEFTNPSLPALAVPRSVHLGARWEF